MSALGRIGLSQAIGSTVDGVAISLAVLHFHATVGIPEATIGVVMAAGPAVSLLLSVPIGMAADAAGLRRAGAALSVLAALALTLYAVADGLPLFAAGAACFFVAQSALNAVRQAAAAAAAPPGQRVRSRAVVYTLLNAGLGLGTVVGILVIATDLPQLAPVAFGVAAILALVSGAVFLGMPAEQPEPSLAAARRPGVVALRDRRFMAVVGLSVVLGINAPVLSVLLPLWVSTRTGAPEWIAAAGLGLNTVIVLLVQTPIASRLHTDRGAVRYALVAAVGFPLACVLIGLGAVGGPVAASVSVLLGIVALTAGEVFGGIASWHLAFHHSPPELQGQYQGTYAMSSSLSRIIGPGLILPLLLVFGVGGWAMLGAAFAAACVLLAMLAARAGRRAHDVSGSRG